MISTVKRIKSVSKGSASVLAVMLAAVVIAPAAAQEASQVEEVVVTGSRIAGNLLAPTPVTSVDIGRLEDRASNNIGDLLNELPAFRATQAPGTINLTPTDNFIGGNILDLRGLGAVRTLVLVNGERFVPSTVSGTLDTNEIPTALIKRIDVVTGGASAQYGTDAVAGVVNIVLDRHFEGLKGNFQYGITNHGDDSDFTASLAGGQELAPGLHFTVGADFERNLGVGDCRVRKFCQVETLNFGRIAGEKDIPANNILPHINPSSTPFGGVTLPKGFTLTGQPILGPGQGITFATDGTPRKFIYGSRVNSFFQIGGQGAGFDGSAFGQDIFFRNQNFVAPIKRYAIDSHLDWDVTHYLTVGLTVDYAHLSSQYFTVPYRNTGFPIKPDNPFIPSSSDPSLDIRSIFAANPGIKQLNFGKGFDEIGPGFINQRNNAFRSVLNFEGTLSDRWSWDAYYQFGKNNFHSSDSNLVITKRIVNALDAVQGPKGPACRINADADPANDDPTCVAFNPFGKQSSLAARKSVVGTAVQANTKTEHVVAANVHGSLFDLAKQLNKYLRTDLPSAGDVGVAIGGEFRNDKLSGSVDPLSNAGAFWTANSTRAAGTVQVTEGYVETEVPVLAHLPAVYELSFNGAVRSAHYDRSSPSAKETTTDATTWKFGAVWEPVRGIRFRADRSRDVRAPNVSELFGATSTIPGILTDTGNGGQQTVVNVISGSNAKLANEISDGTTLGGVLEPNSALADFVGGPVGEFLGNLSLTVDYFEIKINNEISTVGRQNIVDLCAKGQTFFCSLITRNSSGTATDVVDTLQNINRVIERGIDFEVVYNQPLDDVPWLTDWAGDLGNLNFRVNGTYIKSDEEFFGAGGSVQRAGQTGLRAGTPPGLPDLKVDGTVKWDIRALSFIAHVHFINAGKFFPQFVAPGDPGFSIANPNSTNTNSVPSRTYFDLMGQYHFGDERQYMFYVGVDNVADTDPPQIPGAQGTSNNELFTPLGRVFKTGLRFNL